MKLDFYKLARQSAYTVSQGGVEVTYYFDQVSRDGISTEIPELPIKVFYKGSDTNFPLNGLTSIIERAERVAKSGVAILWDDPLISGSSPHPFHGLAFELFLVKGQKLREKYLKQKPTSTAHQEPKGLCPCPWDELDKGIVPHVRALRRAGLNTVACCEGHKGRGDERPKITLEPLPRETTTELRHKAAAVLIGNGYEAFTISEEWLYQHESRSWVGPTPRGLVQISFWKKLPE